eukprot:g35201.t1
MPQTGDQGARQSVDPWVKLSKEEKDKPLNAVTVATFRKKKLMGVRPTKGRSTVDVVRQPERTVDIVFRCLDLSTFKYLDLSSAAKSPKKLSKQFTESFVFSLHSADDSLQDFINSWNHSQNEAISLQTTKCPPHLSPLEFVDFASVRSDGGYAQLHNILLAVSGRKLRFHDEAVAYLLLMATHQVGPQYGKWAAASNEKKFVEAFCSELQKLLESRQKNWAQAYVLCCAVFVTIRLFEGIGNSDAEITSAPRKLLQHCVQMAGSWIEQMAAPRTTRQAPCNSKLFMRRLPSSLL